MARKQHGIFHRAYDAIIEARMRHAERELARYSDIYEINRPRKDQ